MPSILRHPVLSPFVCIGEQCEDTCCHGWSMQVDPAAQTRFAQEAPELLGAIEPADKAWIMRKEPSTGVCVKLEGGRCGIQNAYGERLLSDTCHFYPRVTRVLGEKIVMTAALSCPEITRLALFGDIHVALEAVELARMPQTPKQYLPESMSMEQALSVHQAFLDAADDAAASPERVFLRMASASRSLERIDKSSWPAMAPYYLQHADARLPVAQPHSADPFNLLHALCGLAAASPKPLSARLLDTIREMEAALCVTLDWQQITIHTSNASRPAYRQLQQDWLLNNAAIAAPLLRRWLAMQLSLALYPFAGPGATLAGRITIIGARLATLKLALMAGFARHGAGMPQAVTVRIVQSLSRLLDHLADPAFSLRIYEEAGWMQENRMRGLLET